MAFLTEFIKKQQSEGTSQEALSYIKSSLKGVVNVGEAIVTAFTNTGIAGFKFHCPQKEQGTFNNDITTHYIENNEPVQDHIACQPDEIMLQGFQGEYVYDLHPIKSKVNSAIATVGLITALMPSISEQDQWAKSQFSLPTMTKQLSRDYSTLKATTTLKDRSKATLAVGVDIWQIYQSLFSLKSAQTRAYYFLKALRDSKLLFTVETSWQKFDNMAVVSLTPIRDNNADITDFNVRFRRVQFTETLIVKPDAKGRTAVQKAETQNKGIDKGQEVPFK